MTSVILTRFTIILIHLFTPVKGISVIVEKWEQTTIHCQCPHNVPSITWQLVNGNSTVELSTCTVMDNKCKDQIPLLYRGFIPINETEGIVGLKVFSARINETQFLCLANDSLTCTNNELEIFAWPKKPVCTQMMTSTYVDYECFTANVYPEVTAVLHRREAEFKDTDFDLNATVCTRGHYGSGSEGDYSVSCKWRIPMENMILTSTIFVEMKAALSNTSVVNRTATVSDDIITTLDVPEVQLSQCPYGPGVQGDTILLETVAICKCQLNKKSIGFPRWFTRDGRTVGEEDMNGLVSTLTVSYNKSDSSQSYECRPITLLRVNMSSERYTPKFTNGRVLVEQGQATTLECRIPHNVTSITWQLLAKKIVINISTCGFDENKKCSQYTSSIYKGFISRSDSDRVLGLNISSARTNETQFLCLANNGEQSTFSELEVYAWPTTSNCLQNIGADAITYDWYIDRVYPEVDVLMHRRGMDFPELNIYAPSGVCVNTAHYETLTGLNYHSLCHFSVPIQNMPLQSHIYVEMIPVVSNKSLIHERSTVSNDFNTTLSLPEVVLPKDHCPFGPGVHGETILEGTEASCTCTLQSKGIPSGFARWYTLDHKIVGDVPRGDGSTNLSVTYNSSYPDQTYLCWPITTLNANVTPVMFKPTFISKSSISSGCRSYVVLILGIACSGVVFHLV